MMKSLLLLLTCLSAAQAFPPAPYFTLHGIVRDQVGQTLKVEGATLILLKDGEEIGRTPIFSSLQVDQNYEMQIKIDANRPATSLYDATAVAAGGLYSLAVEMNGAQFLPIETSNVLKVGSGGERLRLDLNLGADTDLDGLPDTWEEWQLYIGGLFPDENGWDLSLLDRDGDFDNDGQSNWQEYVAGTFASDATDRFEMEIKEKVASFIRFEFYAITGKAYTLERLTDDQSWQRVPFAITETGERFETFEAQTAGVLPIYADPSATNSELFRLSVR